MANLQKLVIIGGGEILKAETLILDRETVKLSGKKHPKLLVIPTASSDSENYCDAVKKYFGGKLGCRIDLLLLLKQSLSKKVIKEKILGSDIIYVGGGNTLMMMNVWRRAGVDKLLKAAFRKGIVLSGVSAGSICWFSFGLSDSRRFKNPKADFIRVSGLGLIDALHNPHYHSANYQKEKDRRPDLRKMLKKSGDVGIAVDDHCAIKVLGDKYQVIASRTGANTYKVFWKNGKYFEELIRKKSVFSPLKGLLSK